MSNVKRNGTYNKNPGPKVSTLDKIMAQRRNNDGNSVASQHSSTPGNKRAGSPANKQTPSSVIQVKPSPKTAQKQQVPSVSPRQPSGTNESYAYQDSRATSPNVDQAKNRERYEQFVNQMSAPQSKPAGVQGSASAENARSDHQQNLANRQALASTAQEARRPSEYGQALAPAAHASPVLHHQEPPRWSSPKARHDDKRVSIHGNLTSHNHV